MFGDAELAAPAGGIIGKVVPDGITTSSFVVAILVVAAVLLLPEIGVLATAVCGCKIGLMFLCAIF